MNFEGTEIANELNHYDLGSRNCQTLASSLLVRILCQDRAHCHDHYLFAPGFMEMEFSPRFMGRVLYFTLIHSSPFIGFVFACTESFLCVPYVGTATFLSTILFLLWILFTRPLKFFVCFVGILAAYNVFIRYWGIG